MGNDRNIENVIKEDKEKEISQHDVDKALGIVDGEDVSKIKFSPSFQKFFDFPAMGSSTVVVSETFQNFQNTMPKYYLEGVRKQGNPAGDGIPVGATRFYDVGPGGAAAAAGEALVDMWHEAKFKMENKDTRKAVDEQIQSSYEDRQREQEKEKASEELKELRDEVETTGTSESAEKNISDNTHDNFTWAGHA